MSASTKANKTKKRPTKQHAGRELLAFIAVFKKNPA
jgi:hypothetical protein